MPRPERGERALSIGAPATFVDRLRPDGVIVRWESRRHRKHLKDGPAAGSTWWAPRARGWWIAVLFAVGSLLFAVGSVPGYADAVGDPLGQRDVLRRLAVLHLGRVPHLPGGGRRRPARAEPRPPAVLRLPAGADRLVGHRGATRRHAVLQRQHGGRHRRGSVRAGRASARVAARRDRLGLLPGVQRAGLVRGLPRLGRLAAEDRGRGGSPWPTWWARSRSACPPWPPTSTR